MKKRHRVLALLCCVLLCVGNAFADVATTADTFLQAFIQGKNEEAYAFFDEEMQKAIPRDTFDALWPQIAPTCGTFLSQSVEKTLESSEGTQHIVRLHFEKMDLLAQLTLNAERKIIGFFLKPTPAVMPSATPAPIVSDDWTEEDVLIGKDPWALPGTLTVPTAATGKMPAVVLVHGSGPNDRNESVGGTAIFRDLAHALASRGIAVLRYDKRTLVHGAQFTPEIINGLTVEQETIEDALSAIAQLRADSRIDPARVFLVGHSMGAMLAPRIDAEGGNLTGLVLMAGTPRPLWELSAMQNEALFAQLPAAQQASQRVLLDAELKKGAQLLQMTEEEARTITLFGLPGYYQWDFAKHDTASLVQASHTPILVLQGGRDFQVSPDIDYPLWQEALSQSPDATWKLYPTLNHLFCAYTGAPSFAGTTEEYQTPASLDDAVSKDIGDWILAH